MAMTDQDDEMTKEEFFNWMANVVGETVIVDGADPDDVADWLREIADHLDVAEGIEPAINTNFGLEADEK